MIVEKQSRQVKKQITDLRQESSCNRNCLVDNRIQFRKQSHLIDSIHQCSQIGTIHQFQVPSFVPPYKCNSAVSSGVNPVIQRVATQIELNENGLITHVIIRGRPKSIFAGTMGDHTTAYSVQTEALNLQLVDKNLEEAIEVLMYLSNILLLLPGINFLNLESPNNKIAVKFNDECNALWEAITKAQETLESRELCLSWLQIAINQYLSLRELVPFSTINTKLADTDNFGKGKGEKKPLALLSMYERGLIPNISPEQLCLAVIKLFDYAAASHLAFAENIDEANIYSNGLFIEDFTPGESLMNVIYQQHLDTIELLYPKVYAYIQVPLASMSAEHLNMALSLRMNSILQSVKSIQKQTVAYLSFLERNQYQQRRKDKRNQLDTLVLITKNQNKIIRMKAQIAELSNKLELKTNYQPVLLYLDRWNQTVSAESEKYRNMITPSYIAELYQKSINNIEESASRNTLCIIDQFLSGATLQVSQEQPQIQEELNSEVTIPPIMEVEEVFPDFKDNDIDPRTFISGSSSLAIQLVMDEDKLASGAFVISDMLSEGRPPSPFSQTMGAHTTAWIVHLDRVRKKVIGYSIENAYANIVLLSNDVEAKAISQGIDPEQIPLKQKMKTYETISPSLFALQEFINALLTFYNSIPEVTVDKANTKGHGEGKYRNLLVSFEQGEGVRIRSHIQQAIRNLYDGDRKSNMYKWHLQYIRETYPISFAFAFCFNNAATENASVKESEKIDPDLQEEILAEIPEEVQEQIAEEIPDDLSEMAEQESQKKEQELEVTLPPTDVEEMTEEVFQTEENEGALKSNCLLESIMTSAGIEVNKNKIIKIRMFLRTQGIPYGRLLAATPKLLNFLAEEFGISDRGIMVFYDKDKKGSVFNTDRTSSIGQNPVLIICENHHFRAYVRPALIS